MTDLSTDVKVAGACAQNTGKPAQPTTNVKSFSFALVAGAAFVLYWSSSFVLDARNATTHFGADSVVFRGARPRKRVRPHFEQLFPRQSCTLPPHDSRHGGGLDAGLQPACPVGNSASLVESDVCRCRRRWRMGRDVGFCGGCSARLRDAPGDCLRHLVRRLVFLQLRGIRKSSRLRCLRSTSQAICTSEKIGPCAERSC